ncbi:type II toxin-antitoxin system RelE/ParE family toxin [Halorhodospira abdelmalekii]
MKKLTDHPGYRLRIGDWRVVYTVSAETVTVHVIRIAPRGGAY